MKIYIRIAMHFEFRVYLETFYFLLNHSNQQLQIQDTNKFLKHCEFVDFIDCNSFYHIFSVKHFAFKQHDKNPSAYFCDIP